MNTNQRRLYWSTWRQCLKTMRSQGWGVASDDEDEIRAWLMEKATGRPIDSSSEMDNKDLDKFLAVCWSYTLPGAMGEQLRQLEMPALRARWVMERSLDDAGHTSDPANREKYLEAMSQRICKCSLDELWNQPTLRQKLLAALTYHSRRKSGKTNSYRHHHEQQIHQRPGLPANHRKPQGTPAGSL